MIVSDAHPRDRLVSKLLHLRKLTKGKSLFNLLRLAWATEVKVADEESQCLLIAEGKREISPIKIRSKNNRKGKINCIG